MPLQFLGVIFRLRKIAHQIINHFPDETFAGWIPPARALLGPNLSLKSHGAQPDVE